MGMGGSGIGGDVFIDLIKGQLKIPIETIKTWDIPNSINENTLVLICSYSGNTEETIKKRYETYMSETYPVLNFYKNSQCLYKIDGEKNISEISKQIQQIITSLKG